MRLQPAETIDTPTQAAQVRALTDAEIVGRVLAGDTSLFAILMRRYNQSLFQTVLSMVLNNAEAEDVVQATYVRAYQHLGQIECRARFSTWLTRIAIHEVMDRQRRRRRFTSLDTHERQSRPANRRHDGERPHDERAGSVELQAVLDRALQLPESLRLGFLLRELNGETKGNA
jgi:RNA polymerase sigma-70 factor (ECF subfamily)